MDISFLGRVLRIKSDKKIPKTNERSEIANPRLAVRYTYLLPINKFVSSGICFLPFPSNFSVIHSAMIQLMSMPLSIPEHPCAFDTRQHVTRPQTRHRR